MVKFYTCFSIKYNIVSIYPDVNWSHRDLYHGVVKPVPPSQSDSYLLPQLSKKTITICWTRDGNLSNTDHMFKTNHVVPVVVNRLKTEKYKY